MTVGFVIQGDKGQVYILECLQDDLGRGAVGGTCEVTSTCQC